MLLLALEGLLGYNGVCHALECCFSSRGVKMFVWIGFKLLGSKGFECQSEICTPVHICNTCGTIATIWLMP